jgi:SPP1 family predicted phage head-tail adaptor
MGIRAGLLNRMIEIYKPEVTINEYGEQDETFVYFKTIRAREIYNSGSRNNENGDITYNYQRTFEVRHYQPITERDRIKYNNKMYIVLSIEPLDKENYLRIDCDIVNE